MFYCRFCSFWRRWLQSSLIRCVLPSSVRIGHRWRKSQVHNVYWEASARPISFLLWCRRLIDGKYAHILFLVGIQSLRFALLDLQWAFPYRHLLWSPLEGSMLLWLFRHPIWFPLFFVFAQFICRFDGLARMYIYLPEVDFRISPEEVGHLQP